MFKATYKNASYIRMNDLFNIKLILILPSSDQTPWSVRGWAVCGLCPGFKGHDWSEKHVPDKFYPCPIFAFQPPRTRRHLVQIQLSLMWWWGIISSQVRNHCTLRTWYGLITSCSIWTGLDWKTCSWRMGSHRLCGFALGSLGLRVGQKALESMTKQQPRWPHSLKSP